MSKDGFDNEELIMRYLDGKRVGELNKNWQRFLRDAFGFPLNGKETVRCSKEPGQSKSDLAIKIFKTKGFSVKKTISIKSGMGNSVHQEPVEGFIDFLTHAYDPGPRIAGDIRLFIWGDGTTDGSGEVSKRVSGKAFSKIHPKVVSRLKSFFKKNRKNLIRRFVIAGPKSKSSPDFIYYGNKDRGLWVKSNLALEWLCDERNEATGVIPVGRLTFQAWNRNINGGKKSEHKRGVIQLKWPTIKDDFKKIILKKA